MYYIDDIIKRLISVPYLAVFGAGIMAEAVVSCLKDRPYQLDIQCCLVSDLRENPSHIAGIPVIDFSMADRLLSKDDDFDCFCGKRSCIYDR